MTPNNMTYHNKDVEDEVLHLLTKHKTDPYFTEDRLWNWHKQSLKQFIDELIEREESKKKDEWNIQDEFIESHAEYNEAKRESIAHLKEIKENLTNQPPL